MAAQNQSGMDQPHTDAGPSANGRSAVSMNRGNTLQASTILSFCVSLLLQVVFPLYVVLAYRRRTSAPWQVYAYGAMAYALFSLFTWLPLSVYLDTVLGNIYESSLWAFTWLLATALATSAVECLGRYWAFGYLFKRGGYRLSGRNGVMYGLGHGTVESLLLIAGLTFVNLLAYVALHRLGSDVVLESLGAQANPALSEALHGILDAQWHQPLVVALERILALPHHVAWSLLVMQSRVSRQKRWFGFAVLYQWSVAVIVPGLARLLGFVVAEGVNLTLAALSLWIIMRLCVVASGRD